jgi:hypothetical protein
MNSITNIKDITTYTYVKCSKCTVRTDDDMSIPDSPTLHYLLQKNNIVIRSITRKAISTIEK